MTWYRCVGETGVKPYVIFENGKWQNDNLFDVTISETGSEYISIVNGELVYGNDTTGISLYSKLNHPFILVVSFYSSPTGMYMQTGRCIRGADARICQNTGQDRISFHDWNANYEIPYGTAVENIGYYFAGTQAIFLSGLNYSVKGLYAYDFQNDSCFNYWSN